MTKLKTFSPLGVEIGISSAGQLIMFISQTKILTLELNSFGERMQTLQRATKLTEAELTALDCGLGVLERERILRFKAVSGPGEEDEILDSRLFQLWILTNKAIYAVQFGLQFNRAAQEKPEANYSILDHIPLVKLGIASDPAHHRIFRVGANTVLVSPNCQDVLRLALRTTVDPGSLQLRRSIELLGQAKTKEKFCGAVVDSGNKLCVRTGSSAADEFATVAV